MSNLIKPPSNFTTIPNHIINDDRLSFKAKGLFLYLCSKPDGWYFSADRIKNETKDGKDSILSTLKELENFGLLKRIRNRVKGVLKGNDYALSYDISPKRENPALVKPKREKPSQAKPSMENPASNKEIDSNKYLEEEKREDEILPTEIICSVLSDYPLIEEYIAFVSRGTKYPHFYRASVREALLNDNNSNHNKSFLAYTEFSNTRPDLKNGSLPAGVNIFDLIGRE